MVQRLPYKLVYVSCNASTAWMLDSRCIQNTTSDHRLDYFFKKVCGGASSHFPSILLGQFVILSTPVFPSFQTATPMKFGT